MLHRLSEDIAACYLRAEQARLRAKQADYTALKQESFDMDAGNPHAHHGDRYHRMDMSPLPGSDGPIPREVAVGIVLNAQSAGIGSRLDWAEGFICIPHPDSNQQTVTLG